MGRELAGDNHDMLLGIATYPCGAEKKALLHSVGEPALAEEAQVGNDAAVDYLDS